MTHAERVALRWLHTRAPHETHQLGDVVVFEGVTMTVSAVIAGRAVSVGPSYPRDPDAPPNGGQGWSAGPPIDPPFMLRASNARFGTEADGTDNVAIVTSVAADGALTGLSWHSLIQPPAPPLTPAQRYRLVEIAHETTAAVIMAAALGLLGVGG